ncbi:MAG: hypothetical protein QOF10_4227 [Kribbellaceae bacterium]|jgi:hypothetical protein|nr:hypothetical protein [Kribbellaceae bacterium]
MLDELVRRWQVGWFLARDWTDVSVADGIITAWDAAMAAGGDLAGKAGQLFDALVLGHEVDRLPGSLALGWSTN